MRIEALRALSRLRASAVEDAKRALAEAIRAEMQAHGRMASADERITAEARTALSLGADDGAVEAYARWLPVGRRAAAQARSALDRAMQDVVLARTTVGLARAAEHAVAGELERAEAQIRRGRSARAQTELDEIGARRRGDGDPSGPA